MVGAKCDLQDLFFEKIVFIKGALRAFLFDYYLFSNTVLFFIYSFYYEQFST